MWVKPSRWLAFVAFLWPVVAEGQVFEITRELGAPEHFYFNNPPFSTSATDALPVPALPNVQFAISSNTTIRLRLVAPPGKKFVATRAIYLSWPGDLNLIPTGSVNSGPLHVCPTSWSFTTLAGTAPVSTVEGYKTDGDWLKIRATGTSASSAGFEFTELVLNWNVTGFSGATHTYAMSDGGGWITGPEIDLYQVLANGAPDPGPAVFLEDIVQPCSGATSTWPVCGAPVAVKPGGQVQQYLAPDGAGGVLVSYTHFDSIGTSDDNIWLQHLDANGNPVAGWPADGFPVCDLPLDQYQGRVVTDGSGGAFVAWHDTRNDPQDFFLDVFLKRLTSSGATAVGWPTDGLIVHPITPNDDEIMDGLVSDGAGGVFISWTGRLNRYTASGTVHPNWPANGLAIASGKLLSDGAGGVYVCWWTAPNLRITRITSLGVTSPGWPATGVVVATASVGSFVSDFVLDLGLGGTHVNIGWFESTSGQIRASRVTSTGSVAGGWSANGVLVRTTSNPRSVLNVAHGGSTGDVVLAWREDLPNPDGFQVTVQRLTSTGAVAPSWPAGGSQVIPDGRSLIAFPDCTGGTTLAYSPPGAGFRALRITQAGTVAPGWPSDGVLLCGGGFSHVTPNRNWAIADGTGGVITSISRIQPGSGNPFDRADLYAQCVRGDGSADEGYAGPTPVGSNVGVTVGPATVTFANVTVPGETRLEVADSGPPPPGGVQIVPLNAPIYYDVTTVAQYQGPVQVCITYNPATVQGPESGLRLLHYEGAPPAWVDVTTSLDVNANVICGSTPTLSPFILVEVDPTDVTDGPPRINQLFANVPNPFNPTTTIRYDLVSSGPVRLEILDVSGRLVRTLVNARVEAGSHTAQWSGMDDAGRRVASGVYFYRLQSESFTSTRRMILLK